jgi:hypothetical protein
MLGSANLEEGVAMSIVSLTAFAEIVVRADRALIANTLNGCRLATIAGYFGMNLRRLVSGALAKVVNHESLESLGGVGLDLFLDDLYKVLVDFVLENT